MSSYDVDKLLADLDQKREDLMRELCEIDTAIAVVERMHPSYAVNEEALPHAEPLRLEAPAAPAAEIVAGPTEEELQRQASQAAIDAEVRRSQERILNAFNVPPPAIDAEMVRSAVIGHGRLISRAQIGDAIGHAGAMAYPVIVRVTNEMIRGGELVQIRFSRSNRQVYYGLPTWIDDAGDRFTIDVENFGPSDRAVDVGTLEILAGMPATNA